MTVRSTDFRVQEGHKVSLDKWSTAVEPIYESKKQYQKLLSDHVAQLSFLQQLLYASNRYALLLIFQAMDAAGKDGAIKHVMSGVNPQGCQVFRATGTPARRNCSTIFCGGPPVTCRNEDGSAYSTDPITRRC
jgi:polyphosphate kinase 2 (PPK2 family)